MCLLAYSEYCFAAHLTITSTSVNIHCFSITHALSPMSKNTLTYRWRTHTHIHRHKRIARIKHKIHLFKIINISWERKEQENETRCRIKGVNLCLYIEIKPKYVCARHSYLIAFFIRTRTSTRTHTLATLAGSFLSSSNILFSLCFDGDVRFNTGERDLKWRYGLSNDIRSKCSVSETLSFIDVDAFRLLYSSLTRFPFHLCARFSFFTFYFFPVAVVAAFDVIPSKCWHCEMRVCVRARIRGWLET